MARGDHVGHRSAMLIGLVWMMATMGVMTVLLRLYGTRYKAGKLSMDFLWIVIAVAWGITSAGCITTALLYGPGEIGQLVSQEDNQEAYKWLWIALLTNVAGQFFAKAAIISLLLQVNAPSAKKRKCLLLSLAILLGVACSTLIALMLFRCTPVEKGWYLSTPGVCSRQAMLAAVNTSYFQGALSAFADIFLSLYPISIVYGLKTDRRTKLAFCFLMASGAIPSAAVIARTAISRTLALAVLVQDPHYDMGPYLMAAAAEIWSIIIIGSAPALRPLILHFINKSKDRVRQASVRDMLGTPNSLSGIAFTSFNRAQAGDVSYFDHEDAIGRMPPASKFKPMSRAVKKANRRSDKYTHELDDRNQIIEMYHEEQPKELDDDAASSRFTSLDYRSQEHIVHTAPPVYSPGGYNGPSPVSEGSSAGHAALSTVSYASPSPTGWGRHSREG